MKNNTVVLIDDDSIQHYITKVTFKKVDKDIKLMSFLDAGEALKYIKSLTASELPDFILLDLNMPNITGWDFLNIYQYLEHKSAVYIVSSSIDALDIKKSEDYLDVKHYFSKPLNAEKIRSILNQNI